MSIPTVGPTSNGASNYEHVPIKDVTDFHKYSDIDGTSISQHHTLGPGANQASPGNHSHDGGASQALVGIDTTMLVDTINTQYINGQKQFAQPIVGSFISVPVNEQTMMDDKIATHAAAGARVTGGQVYVPEIAANFYYNVTIGPGLSGISSLVANMFGSGRITCSVLDMTGASATIQASNNTGFVSTAGYINWVAVGY